MSGATAFFLRLCLFGLAAFTLVGGTMTLAADQVASPNVQSTTPAKQTLVVPEVRGQVYVFAKGILEDAGFAWQVVGNVQGYAANTISRQRPKPGTIVVAFGAPLRAAAAAVFCCALVVVTATDIERRIVPNRVVGPALVVVLALQTIDRPSLEWAIASASASAFLLIAALVYPAGMGLGDV